MGSALALTVLGVPFPGSSGNALPTANLLFDYASENYNASTGDWVDSSGNNNTATQSTSGARPTVETNALNGYSALVFDGSNDTLLLPIGINNVAQYFAVFKSVGSTWNAFGSVLSNRNSGTRIGGIFNPGNTDFYPDPLPTSVRKNGVALSGSYNLSPISANYFVMTLRPANQTGSLQIGALENTFFGAIKLVRLAGYSAAQTEGPIESILITKYAVS